MGQREADFLLHKRVVCREWGRAIRVGYVSLSDGYYCHIMMDYGRPALLALTAH